MSAYERTILDQTEAILIDAVDKMYQDWSDMRNAQRANPGPEPPPEPPKLLIDSCAKLLDSMHKRIKALGVDREIDPNLSRPKLILAIREKIEQYQSELQSLENMERLERMRARAHANGEEFVVPAHSTRETTH